MQVHGNQSLASMLACLTCVTNLTSGVLRLEEVLQESHFFNLLPESFTMFVKEGLPGFQDVSQNHSYEREAISSRKIQVTSSSNSLGCFVLLWFGISLVILKRTNFFVKPRSMYVLLNLNEIGEMINHLNDQPSVITLDTYPVCPNKNVIYNTIDRPILPLVKKFDDLVRHSRA